MIIVINIRLKVIGVIYWVIGILLFINKFEKNCVIVKIIIFLGVISVIIICFFLVILVFNVERSIEIGFINIIIIKLKSMSC